MDLLELEYDDELMIEVSCYMHHRLACARENCGHFTYHHWLFVGRGLECGECSCPRFIPPPEMWEEYEWRVGKLAVKKLSGGEDDNKSTYHYHHSWAGLKTGTTPIVPSRYVPGSGVGARLWPTDVHELEFGEEWQAVLTDSCGLTHVTETQLRAYQPMYEAVRRHRLAATRTADRSARLLRTYLSRTTYFRSTSTGWEPPYDGSLTRCTSPRSTVFPEGSSRPNDRTFRIAAHPPPTPPMRMADFLLTDGRLAPELFDGLVDLHCADEDRTAGWPPSRAGSRRTTTGYQAAERPHYSVDGWLLSSLTSKRLGSSIPGGCEDRRKEYCTPAGAGWLGAWGRLLHVRTGAEDPDFEQAKQVILQACASLPEVGDLEVSSWNGQQYATYNKQEWPKSEVGDPDYLTISQSDWPRVKALLDSESTVYVHRMVR